MCGIAGIWGNEDETMAHSIEGRVPFLENVARWTERSVN